MTTADIIQDLEQHDSILAQAALLAPEHMRAGLYAVYALHMELGQVKAAVSEAMVGQIKLQWWAEAIDGLREGQVRAHPILQALSETIDMSACGQALADMAEGRFSDFEDTSLSTLEALEAYARLSYGGLLQALSAHLAGPSNELAAAGAGDYLAVARHLGTAYGLCRFVAAIGRADVPAHLQNAPAVAESAQALVRVAEKNLVLAQKIHKALKSEKDLSLAGQLRLAQPVLALAGPIAGRIKAANKAAPLARTNVGRYIAALSRSEERPLRALASLTWKFWRQSL